MFGYTGLFNDKLFIGDANTASDKAFMDRHRIDLVVNMTRRVPNYFEKQGIEYIHLPLDDVNDDTNNQLMVEYLRRVVPIINMRLWSGKTVLVHCMAGVSRSCTVVAGVIRSCCEKTLRGSFDMILIKRPVAFYGGLHFYFKRALETVYGKDRPV